VGSVNEHERIPPVLWIISTMLALVMTAILLAGCGSGNHASSNSATLGASTHLTNPETVAYAHVVNLRAADAPGLVPAARQKEGTGIFLGRCERPAGSGEAVGIPSQAFRQNLEHPKGSGTLSIYPEESVRSAVYTTTSSTLAAHAVAVAIGTVGQACLRQSFLAGGGIVSSESGQEPVFTKSIVSELHIPVGRVQIQGMRASASLAADMANAPNRQPYYEDVLGFSSGPHEIFLKVTSSPRDPTATDRRLLTLLYSRAEAHKLG
jgi:hypothetical protein